MGSQKNVITMNINLFSSKANNLIWIKNKVAKSFVDSLYIFTVKEWKSKAKVNIVITINNFFLKPIIIRSSALSEDTQDSSKAGHYISVANIDPSNKKELIEAIEKVINSYDKENDQNQIFIQQYFTDLEMSGVIFTRDIGTRAPYITINYDVDSGKSHTVTSGGNFHTKTLVIFKDRMRKVADKRMGQIYDAAIELEKLFNYEGLDIEFFYHQGKVHILQVRPIIYKDLDIQNTDIKRIKNTLQQISNRIKQLKSPHPDLYGIDTIYGVMPDWNPAEMIGINPRPLALSLYRELITDNIWAYQRDNYGYKKLRSFPLMLTFAGHPYIDLRVDFNSFIPKSLSDNLSHKLANYYLNKLKMNPASHDKVEFDILYSCYTFDLNLKVKDLTNYGFSTSEIKTFTTALRELTLNVIGTEKKEGLYREDINKLEILENRRKILMRSNQTYINKIYWLIEDCKRYGTLPFAGVARSAFIATQLLDSLVNLKIITVQDKEKFINSLNTVTRQITCDVILFQNGDMSVKAFKQKYGHLRPGTYDILTDSYEENLNAYFDIKNNKFLNNELLTPINFSFNNNQINMITNLLQKNDLPISGQRLIKFIKESIEGREYTKFIFTKNINNILTSVKKYGFDLGFNADDMSYLEIGTLLKLYSTVAFYDERDLLDIDIKRNRKTYEYYKAIKLPHLITKPKDLFIFHLDSIKPNFVTTYKTQGEIINLNTKDAENISNKIVFIESADPGYDWIFSHQIKGLVTMYGGANSHMAIRCAELNIPGVIGCGSVSFEQLVRFKKIQIDCINKKVIGLI